MAKIKVENTEISVVNVQNEDYISLTDMAHSQNARAYYFQMDEPQKYNRIPR